MLCLSGVLGRQDGLGDGVDDVGYGESQSLRKCEFVVVVGGGNPIVEPSSTPTCLGWGGNGSSVEVFCVNEDDAAFHVELILNSFLCLFIVRKTNFNPSTHTCQQEPINTSLFLTNCLFVAIMKPFNTAQKADEVNPSTHVLPQHHAHISPRSPDISSSRISEN